MLNEINNAKIVLLRAKRLHRKEINIVDLLIAHFAIKRLNSANYKEIKSILSFVSKEAERCLSISALSELYDAARLDIPVKLSSINELSYLSALNEVISFKGKKITEYLCFLEVLYMLEDDEGKLVAVHKIKNLLPSFDSLMDDHS